MESSQFGQQYRELPKPNFTMLIEPSSAGLFILRLCLQYSSKGLRRTSENKTKILKRSEFC